MQFNLIENRMDKSIITGRKTKIWVKSFKLLQIYWYHFEVKQEYEYELKTCIITLEKI